MCRWLAYSGSPIRMEELLVKRDRSLIDQSLHTLQGATTTNGDGFGVGWYEEGEPPRVYRRSRSENEQLAGLSEKTRVVVSEPLGDLAGAWNEVPESHYGIVQPGQDVLEPFSSRR
jgi:predicted glutamine amidotransferase